ncbi:hypothetical protein IV203_031976 [Nitzschia inconspicua]|uniref:Uncharacterized protein n=1 Tax=Nitzschia inconspicua TaxID=303405 RepID=A0A9K3LVE5_9STRA|nr:hypothetical protein IV203_031976 [Nitzschia inconspicua]
MFGSSRNETIISTEQTRLLSDNANHDVMSLVHPETRISSDYNWRSVVASKLQGVPGMFLLAAMLLMGLALASHSARTASIGGHHSQLRGTKYSMVSSVWAGRQSENEDFVTVSPTLAPTSEPTQMSTMTTSPTFSPSILASTTSTTTNSPTSIVVPTSVPTNTATSVPTSTTETFSPTSFVEFAISTESDDSSAYETQSIPDPTEIGDLLPDTNTAEISSIDTLFPSSTPGDTVQDDLPENQIDFTNVKNETNSNTVEGNSTNDVLFPSDEVPLSELNQQTEIENESTAQELLPQSANATQTIPEPTDIGDLPSETNTAETANIDTLFPSSTPEDADRDDVPKNQIDFTTTVEDETDANTLKANATNDVPIPIEANLLQPLTPQMEVEMSGESTTQELSPEFKNEIGKDDDQGQVTEEAFSNDAQNELVDKVLAEPTIELEDGIESHGTVVDELTFINDTITANDIEENTSDSMTIDVEEAEDDSFPETSQAETRHVDFIMDSFDESNDAARNVDADSVDSISEDIIDALQTEEPTIAPTLTPTISSETADLLFAGSLIDDKGFFFPMSLPSKESKKTTHSHHKNHGEITGLSDERNPWDESWDKTNLKDLAAVAEYYHVKGKWLETIFEQNSEKGKNSKVNERHHDTKHHQTRSVTRDWEEDTGRGLKMSQIFLTIANTIDNHYESLNRDGEQAASWVDDQNRGRKLIQLYHKLANLIGDHYDEEQHLDESGTKSSSDSYMVQGLKVSKYYEEKSSEMEEYLNRKNTFENHSKDLHDAGVKQFLDDDYSSALHQLREDQGNAVHNYFRAVYDASYKQELQSKLPDHYPDKDFPRWGRDWRADRDHGIAIGNYWKQYHDVMKTFYEEQGNKLRKLYTEFYTQRFH